MVCCGSLINESLMPESLVLVALNHVARRTRHLAESTAFYRDVLGMRVVARPPFTFDGAWLCGGGIQLHLIAEGQPDAVEPSPIETRANHISFAVADIDSMEQRLRDFAIPYVRKEIPDWNVPQIFFHDPDGHVVEIGMYRPIDYMG